jgi:hypothetical protein
MSLKDRLEDGLDWIKQFIPAGSSARIPNEIHVKREVDSMIGQAKGLHERGNAKEGDRLLKKAGKKLLRNDMPYTARESFEMIDDEELRKGLIQKARRAEQKMKNRI